MAGRTCASCGAAVGVLPDRCPACGADPDLQLLELGVGSGRRRVPPNGQPPPPRRRIGWRQWAPIAAAFVGVWGFLAATAGSDGDDGDDGTEEAADDPSSTTRRKREDRPPLTRRGSRLTTTTVVGDGGPVLGEPTGWHLVIGGDTGMVLDLDRGTIDRVGAGRVLAIGSGGVVLDGRAGAEWLPAPFVEGSAVPLAEGDYDQAWVGSDGTVWLNGYEQDRGTYDPYIVRATLDGEPAERFDPAASAWPFGATSAGLLLNGPNGVYVMDHDGDYRRISEGSGMGSNGDLVVVLSCDAELDCRIERIDANDGSVLDAGEGGDDGGGGDEAIVDQRGAPVSVSPDGRVAHVFQPGDGPSYLAVDGLLLAEVLDPYLNAAAWSPDGRWLAVAMVGRVRLFDTVGAEPAIEVPTGGDSWLLGFVVAGG